MEVKMAQGTDEGSVGVKMGQGTMAEGWGVGVKMPRCSH